MTGSGSPFVRAAEVYRSAGWLGTIPLRDPEGGRTPIKWPPPREWTGYGAPYPKDNDVRQWVGEDIGFEYWSNIALRMPQGDLEVVAIDVDAYKGGGDTLAKLEERLGPLPRTYMSSARFETDPVGGHYFYRVPHIENYVGEAGPGIDVLNHHHRYALVWPSVNPDVPGGPVYRWRDPIGRTLPEGEVPRPADLTPLPEAWVHHLTSQRVRIQAATMSLAETDEWLARCRRPTDEYPMCGIIRRGTEAAIRTLKDPKATRHATARDWTRAIAGFGGEGHVGAPEALDELRQAFVKVLSTPGQGGGRVVPPTLAGIEYDSMAIGATRIAAAQNPKPRIGCECPSYVGLTSFRPTDAPPRPEGAEGYTPSTLGPSLDLDKPGVHTGSERAPVDPVTGSLPVESMPPLEGVKRTPGEYGQNDDEMALCYVDWFRDEVRYVADGNVGWLFRQGSTWRQDIEGRHREIARRLFRMIPENDVWRKYRKATLTSAGVSGVLNLAKTDERLVTRITHLDRNPWALNTPGGVVDLKTGELRQARADEMHTRVTAVTPKEDPEAVRPWLNFLNRVFAGNAELIAYVQRLCGMALVGHSDEAILPFLFGTGRNGKNVLVEVLAYVLSVDDVSGYARMAGSNFLMARNHEPHPTDLASLMGRRVVICSEVNKGAKFDEERVKALTGNAIVNARKMRTDEFTFPAVHTLFMLGNNYPEVTAGGPSFWERVRIIPFDVFIPKEERIKGLAKQLAAGETGAAVLAWFIDGAVAYAKNGLDPTPSAVMAATEEYADDQNHLARFVEDRLTLGGGTSCQELNTAVFAEYEQWCRQNRIRPEVMHKSNWLARALKAEMGITTVPRNSKTYYVGVSLTVGRGPDAPRNVQSDLLEPDN